MKRFWPLLALLLVAATRSPEETKQFRMARAAFRDGLYDLAERQLADLLEKYPQSEYAADAQLLLAQAQLNQGKWPQAVKTLRDAITKFPDKKQDSYRFWQAEALMAGEQFGDAAKVYSELIEKFPRSSHHAQSQYGLALAQFRLGRRSAALDTLDKLKKSAPNKYELLQEADLLRGQILLAQEKFEQADAIFASLIEQSPGLRVFYRAQYWSGESLARRGQSAEALQRYAIVTDAFKAAPNKPVDSQLAAEAWFGAGWAHWQQEHFADAAEAFSQALNAAQTARLKRDALLKLGEACVRAGKRADGVAKLRAFLQAHPNDPIADEVQMAVADLLLASDDVAAAQAAYAHLIAHYPKSPLLMRANFNAGICAWKLNQADKALAFFKETFALATAVSPATKESAALAAEALFKMGDAQFALGQYTDAIASYQRLVSSYADSKLMDRALFQLGESYQRARNGEAAAAAFESLVEQYPTSPQAAEAQYEIGRLQIALGKETDARAAFSVVVKKYPDSPWAGRAALAIGESFYREGKYDEAIAEFERLIAAAPDSEIGQRAFYNRGWCYYQKGQDDKTLADFTEFLKKYPQSPLAPDVQFWLADNYSRQKDYIKAQENFQAIPRNYPSSKLADTAQYFAGRAAFSRQDYKAAIELYEALLKNFPDSSWRCDARFGEGDAMTELAQFDNALLVFDTLIKDFPDCYLRCEAYGRKGDCQFSLGRYEDALTSYRAALVCLPLDADPSLRNQVAFKIGQAFEKLGKLSDAFEAYSKTVYEESVAPDPSVPRERFWMCKCGLSAGGIKEQQQQWREAITLYQKLLPLCPDMKPLLEERARKLRVEHFILF